MSSRKLAPPFFADPPREYSYQYFSELVRTFAIFVSQQKNPGEGRQTSLVLTNMQQGDAGLETGTLFLDGNVVKIAMLDMTVPTPSTLTSSLGVVSVTVV